MQIYFALLTCQHSAPSPRVLPGPVTRSSRTATAGPHRFSFSTPVAPATLDHTAHMTHMRVRVRCRATSC